MADGFHGSVVETRIVRRTQVLDVTRSTATPAALDVRTTQARVLWNDGWGRARFASFGMYLATIPLLPRAPADARFWRPVLVDTSMRLTQACRVLGVAYGGDDTVLQLPPSRACDGEVYWMWVNTNLGSVGIAPFDVAGDCGARECPLNAYEGIALFAQFPRIIEQRTICCAASRLCSFPAYCACLLVAEGQPTLGVAEYCVSGADRMTPLRWW